MELTGTGTAISMGSAINGVRVFDFAFIFVRSISINGVINGVIVSMGSESLI
jgi:hypothetical protein